MGVSNARSAFDAHPGCPTVKQAMRRRGPSAHLLLLTGILYPLFLKVQSRCK